MLWWGWTCKDAMLVKGVKGNPKQGPGDISSEDKVQMEWGSQQ